MLKRIPLDDYIDDDEITYRICVECYMDDYRKIYEGRLNKDRSPALTDIPPTSA